MLYFPEVDDIRLQRVPLTEVIGQVRFPPILRIANENPVEFQEKIRIGSLNGQKKNKA
jgi:uncharacterized protein (TIGR04255 family)